MYGMLLILHNLTRWAVVIAAIWALFQMYSGWLGRREWSAQAAQASRIYPIVLDVQFLIGVILYIVSPLTQAAMQDFGGAMGNSDLRYFAVEHVAMMSLAVVAGHVGSSMAKRATEDAKKYRNAAIWFTISVLLILGGMPWARPLFPGL